MPGYHQPQPATCPIILLLFLIRYLGTTCATCLLHTEGSMQDMCPVPITFLSIDTQELQWHIVGWGIFFLWGQRWCVFIICFVSICLRDWNRCSLNKYLPVDAWDFDFMIQEDLGSYDYNFENSLICLLLGLGRSGMLLHLNQCGHLPFLDLQVENIQGIIKFPAMMDMQTTCQKNCWILADKSDFGRYRNAIVQTMLLQFTDNQCIESSHILPHLSVTLEMNVNVYLRLFKTRSLICINLLIICSNMALFKMCDLFIINKLGDKTCSIFV